MFNGIWVKSLWLCCSDYFKFQSTIVLPRRGKETTKIELLNDLDNKSISQAELGIEKSSSDFMFLLFYLIHGLATIYLYIKVS